LVMDLLGPTLENLKHFCRGRMTLKTVLMLADQMIDRLQFVHGRGIICRDLKPDNFAMGMGNAASSRVHLFDFGLAKLFRDPKTAQHIPLRTGLVGLGAPRYASFNVHLGREQARRDDLEALGYTFLYLLRGSLPWQGIMAPTVQDKIKRIGEKKELSLLADACQDQPPELFQYFEYCRSLTFEAAPDYDFVRALLKKVMDREGWAYDWKYDWCSEVVTPAGNLLPSRYLH